MKGIEVKEAVLLEPKQPLYPMQFNSKQFQKKLKL